MDELILAHHFQKGEANNIVEHGNDYFIKIT